MAFHEKRSLALKTSGVFHEKMDRQFKDERFQSMSIKVSVARKFRRFARAYGRSQSVTLLAMIDYFERHGISPDEHLGQTLGNLKYLIQKRFNALIAIVRSIEKEQTLPTVSMLQALFEQELQQSETLEDDFDFIEAAVTEKDFIRTEELEAERTVPKIRYERLQGELRDLKKDFVRVLSQVTQVKKPMGGEQLRLHMRWEEIQHYKRKLTTN